MTLLKKIVKKTVATIIAFIATTIKEESKEVVSFMSQHKKLKTNI